MAWLICINIERWFVSKIDNQADAIKDVIDRYNKESGDGWNYIESIGIDLVDDDCIIEKPTT